MKAVNDLALLTVALDPTRILTAQGLAPDPWQREVLFCRAQQILLNCCRGAGKSRTTSALALHTALFEPCSLVLLISRSQRQSGELFRYVKQGFRALGRPLGTVKETTTQLEFSNASRIVCLPGKEETIRSFQGVKLLVLDEAARIPDDLYASVSPMTGVSRGRTICLSTPFGQRGWWYKEWHDSQSPWQRFRVPWQRCPRLSREFIGEEKRKFGEHWISQEYECSFTAMEGLVYPDFLEQTRFAGWNGDRHLLCEAPEGRSRQKVPVPLPSAGKRVGGIDFGFRNPFAALWGQVQDDTLHIENEVYVRETPLCTLLGMLPKNVMWSADPAGASEIEQMRLAGFNVRKGKNDIRAGIAAVTARLQSGRLKVHEQRCPNTLSEARLYRYPSPSERVRVGENPVDDNNHAMAALRYLISRLDARMMSKYRRSGIDHDAPFNNETPASAPAPQQMNLTNPDLWKSL
jgi:hypothetical protein